MRISTSMIYDAGIGTINRQTSSLLHIQQQIANNTRILRPSDDPVAAARSLEVTQQKDVAAQFTKNHNNVNSALGLAETQLTSMSDLIARVRELAVQGGNTSLAGSDRRAITAELRARFEEMMGIANSTDGSGQYLFSGYMGATKPFGDTVDHLIAGNEVTYQGDDGQRKLQVSATRFLEVSDSGNEVFKRIPNGNGYFVTGFNSANTGTGIVDAGNITEPATWNALTDKSYVIKFTVNNSVTYYDIVNKTSGNSMLTGGPTPTALASQRVFQPNQPIMLKSQGLESAFDLGGSVTISGDPANGDSFSMTPSSSQSVFKTLANLISSLESGSTRSQAATVAIANNIGFALTDLDQATENILRVRSQIGARMTEVDSLSKVNEDLSLQYQQTLSQLQDLDYAKALSDLTRKQTDLEAAQKSFISSSKLSLFNYI